MSHVSRVASYLPAFVPLTLLPLGALAIGVGVHPVVAAWFPMLFLFVIVPVLDQAVGVDRTNPPDESAMQALEAQRAYRVLTWIMAPAWLVFLAWAVGYVATQPFGIVASIGWLLSLGIAGGVAAINTAHELIHKTGRWEPALGGVLLSSVIYAGFKVEHLRGHHVHVSTPLDASTARYGQSLYQFLPRAVWHNARNAWALEAKRLHTLGLPALHWRNELIGWYALSAVFAAGCALAFGPWGLFAFVAQGFIAGGTLEIINYIEHYGLERAQLADGRYERVTHRHSWNASQRVTNRMLFQLQRHSDHHANARRRYQALLHHDDSPQLPMGYAGMLMLALIPPLWHRIVDPLVLQWRSTHGSR